MSAGSVSEKSVIRTGLQMHEVAVSIRGVEKRADGIRPELREHSENRIPARSGRELGRIRTSRADHVGGIIGRDTRRESDT